MRGNKGPQQQGIHRVRYHQFQNLLNSLLHGVTSLKGFGIDDNELGVCPAAAVLYYLSQTQPKLMGHINHVQVLRRDDHMWMDAFTIRNLDFEW